MGIDSFAFSFRRMPGRTCSRPAWKRVFARAAIACAIAMTSGLAHAAGYPERTVKIIVPFAAGGATDVAARLIAQKLSEMWGQSVIVEDRPGAGSVLGSQVVSTAQPDGYTILIGISSALIENSIIMKHLPYDPIKGFAPITQLYKISGGISVNNDVPAKTIAELVALAKTKSLSFSSFGYGTGPQILLERFDKAAGIKMVHVPYKGGAPGIQAAVSGEVQVVGAGLGTIKPYLESGQLRLLAVEGNERSKFAPGVPSLKELGYPDLIEGSNFVGAWAPPGTPADIINKLNHDLLAVMASPAFKAYLDRLAYYEAEATTPQQLEDLVKTSIAYWRPILTSLNIEIE